MMEPHGVLVDAGGRLAGPLYSHVTANNTDTIYIIAVHLHSRVIANITSCK